MLIQARERTVFYGDGGRKPSQGEPLVVFVHAAGADHSIWTLQARYFAHHGYAVCAIDLPGHGRSAGPSCTTIEDMADVVSSAISLLERDVAMLVGHSMGALVAIEVAARIPNLIDRLALLGAGIPMTVNDKLLIEARRDVPKAARIITGWGHAPGARMGGHPAPGLWMTGGAVRLIERVLPKTLHADLLSCDKYRAGCEVFTNIICPTILLNGSLDRMVPRHASLALAQKIAIVESIDINSGHFMMSEMPDAVLDALRKFIAREPA